MKQCESEADVEPVELIQLLWLLSPALSSRLPVAAFSDRPLAFVVRHDDVPLAAKVRLDQLEGDVAPLGLATEVGIVHVRVLAVAAWHCVELGDVKHQGLAAVVVPAAEAGCEWHPDRVELPDVDSQS